VRKIYEALLVATLAVLGVYASSANASTITLYQSIPDLTVSPQPLFLCSKCGSGTAIWAGQEFSIGSAGTASSVTFAVINQSVGATNTWPNSVTVGLYRDAGGGTIVANLYNRTFSSFVSDNPTGSSGFSTDVVSVDLGAGVPLPAGNYLVFLMSNTGNGLWLPTYWTSMPSGAVVNLDGSYPNLAGGSYQTVGFGDDLGIAIDGHAGISVVPLPAALPLFGAALAALGGFGWLGAKKTGA